MGTVAEGERRLNRRNDLDLIDILKNFHDEELSKTEPDDELMANCKKLVELIEARHKREDANGH